jgi:hypothetical protein
MAIFTSKDLPNVRPVADFNFAATKTLDRKITFSRDSIGTYTDELGVVRYATNNVPRFDHDPSTGRCLGLLIEESRTNILYGTPSQGNTINSYNQYNSLTGEYNATKLAKNSPTTSQSHGTWNSNGNLSTTSFVISVFVKKINHASFFMQAVSSGVGDNLYVYYNIDTGVTSFTDFSSPGNLTVTRSIENYHDGWFRLIARVEGFSNAALHSGFRFGFAHPTNNAQQYQDSSDEVLVYGAQAEVGDFATSYIPTHESTTSVTRAQDQAIIKKENFTKIFDTGFNSFSALIDYNNLSTADTSSNYDIFTLWGESTGYRDRISMSKDNAAPFHLETRAFADNAAMFNNGNFTADSKAAAQKIAFSWNIPDHSTSTGRAWKLAFSGEMTGSPGVGTSTVAPALTRLGIGINPTRLTEPAGRTHFKRVAIYNQVLSDEELKSISAI